MWIFLKFSSNNAVFQILQCQLTRLAKFDLFLA